MIASLALAALSTSLLIGAVVLLRMVEVQKAFQGASILSLRFARDTDPDAVTTFLSGLSGIRPTWIKRWLHLPTVVFEVHAEHGHIRHSLIVPRAIAPVVTTHLRSALPSVRVEAVDPDTLDAKPLNRGVELRLSTARRPLRTDRPAQAATALLGSLQPLAPRERVIIQWLITPAPLPKPVRLPQGKEDMALDTLAGAGDYELLPHAEAVKAERAKQAESLFWAVGRVAVAAPAARQRQLISRVLACFHLLNAPGVELLRRSFVAPSWGARRTAQRTVPTIVWPALLNAAELTSLIGFPVGITQAPGLELGGCRQLAPSSDIPTTGYVIGRSTYPGSERPLAVSPTDLFLHSHWIGPTGAGKSASLLTSIIVPTMQSGRGLVVIEPAGDLVRESLARVPDNRIKDVIVLDPADDDDRLVGFNLLATDAVNAELVAENVVYIFHSLFAGFWGPRTDDVLRSSLLTLMTEPGMTLAEVPLLLTNPNFRRRFVARVSDDVVGLGSFWAWYDALSPGEAGQVTAPLLNKLRATLLRSRVRFCVGQASPGLDIDRALAEQKLLFVPLSKGQLGDAAAALLGSMVVSRIWQSVQSRSGLPEADRPQTNLVIDEVQDYLRLPTSIGDMLAQARKLKCSVNVAHQHLGQLPAELKADLLANCRTRVVYQPNAKDAHVFEQELRPYLTAEDLQGLGQYEVVARIAVNQRTTPPATGRTLPPPAVTGNQTAAREWSREHYGRRRSAIAAELRARHEPTARTTAIGRRRLGEDAP